MPLVYTACGQLTSLVLPFASSSFNSSLLPPFLPAMFLTGIPLAFLPGTERGQHLFEYCCFAYDANVSVLRWNMQLYQKTPPYESLIGLAVVCLWGWQAFMCAVWIIFLLWCLSLKALSHYLTVTRAVFYYCCCCCYCYYSIHEIHPDQK